MNAYLYAYAKELSPLPNFFFLLNSKYIKKGKTKNNRVQYSFAEREVYIYI